MKRIEVLCKQSEQVRVVAAVIHDTEDRIFATQRGYGEWKVVSRGERISGTEGARSGTVAFSKRLRERGVAAG